jgi:TfoX/Sxy family transcriptional regulator of competence genes
MCRIDPAIHDAALQHGCKSVIMKGREYRGYVHVAADALKTKRELDYWVRLALDYNSHAEASTAKRQPSKRGGFRYHGTAAILR